MSIQVGIMYLDYLVHSVIKTVAWVHRGLQARSGKTKDYDIEICFPAKHAASKSKKTFWLE